jgi:hypothetical protein
MHFIYFITDSHYFNKLRKDKIYDSGKEKQFKAKKNRTIENKKLQIRKSGKLKKNRSKQ